VLQLSGGSKLSEAVSRAAKTMPLSLSRLMRNIRRNHALEHATVHVLSRSLPSLRVVGRTTPMGFYLYGDIDTELVEEAVREAVDTLKENPDLAVHSRCGTSLAVTAMLAGLAAFAAESLPARSRWMKLPSVLLASLWGVLVAQPLGLAMQRTITTDSDVEGAVVGPVRKETVRGVTTHFVPIWWEQRE